MGITEEVICSPIVWIRKASGFTNWVESAEGYWNSFVKARVMVVCLSDRDRCLAVLLLRVLPKQLGGGLQASHCRILDEENREMWEERLYEIVKREAKKMRRDITIFGDEVPGGWRSKL